MKLNLIKLAIGILLLIALTTLIACNSKSSNQNAIEYNTDADIESLEIDGSSSDADDPPE